MEQIEAGKRKESKERQKWSTSSTISKRSTSSSVSRSEEKETYDDGKFHSRHIENINKTQKSMRGSKSKKSLPNYKLDQPFKNNNHKTPSNDSTTTSAMTSPITDLLPPDSSSNPPTSIDIIASEYHPGFKTIISEQNIISKNTCRRSNANGSSKYDEISWDRMSDIVRKDIDHQNEYSYKKINDQGSFANVVTHTSTDNSIFGEHSENIGLAPHQFAEEIISGKSTKKQNFSQLIISIMY